MKKTALDWVIPFVKRRPLSIIVLLAIIYQIYIFYSVGIRWNDDTRSYIEAGEVLMRGDIDEFRTPCYPFLFAIGNGNVFMPGHNDMFVAIVQIIVFFLSIVPFNRIIQKIGIARNITVIITMVYALSPTILHYNVYMRTESLALYFSIFWLYCFIDWWQDYKWRNIVGLGLCTFYLVFLRPSFLYLLVVMSVVACVYLMTRKYRRFVQIGGIVLLVGCAVYAYSKRVEEKTGIYTISTVSILNDWCITCRVGLFTSDNVTNEKIKERLTNYNAGESLDWDLYFSLSDKELYDEIQQIKSRYKWEWYLKCIKHNFADSISKPTLTESTDWLSFRVIWPFMFVAGIYIACDWIRRKRVPIIVLTLWLMCMGNLGVNILGSYAEWNRLFLPSFPIVLIMLAMGCNLFRIQFRPTPLA